MNPKQAITHYYLSHQVCIVSENLSFSGPNDKIRVKEMWEDEYKSAGQH